MGIWTGIKHALNSTLGTNSFQPLDQIIKGQRTLSASDNIIAPIVTSSVGGSSTYVFGTFIPNTVGSVKLVGIGKAYSTSGGSFIVKKNGEETNRFTLPYNTSTAYGDDFSYVLNIEQGAVYEFSGVGIYCRTLNVCADVIDGSLFSYTPWEEVNNE